MLNVRPVPIKWKIVPDLGPATASAGCLLVFKCCGAVASLPTC